MTRIALFFPSLTAGGVERVMLTLAHAFAERGDHVDMVVGTTQGELLPEVDPRVTLHDLHIPPPSTFSRLPGLVRYLRQARPEALLSATDGTNLVALWARLLAGVPTQVITSTHLLWSAHATHAARLGLGNALKYHVLMPTFIRLSYRHAERVVAVTHAVAHDLARVSGIAEEQITVIHNPVVSGSLLRQAAEAVDHPWFAPAAPPVILGVGRLHADKDFATLIRAFSLLRQRRPARLLIVGDGPERPALEALVAELGVSADVALPGFTANPYALMRQAAVLALSSRAEGFGNVLIEAMASGTPVVSTNCPGGPPELLMHGRYGRLVPVGDAAALAEAIEATVDNPPAPAFLRERAQEFSVERSVQQYAALVDALVAQPAPAATTVPAVPAPVHILGVQVHPITLAQLLALLPAARAQQRRLIISNVNVHALNLAYRLDWFRAFLNTSDVVFCDGVGVKLGAKLLGYHLPQRFTPPDWLDQLITVAITQGWSLFLLGARPGVALRAANRLRDHAPGLTIAGVHHGYFDQTPGSAENESVVRYINAVKPDILLIGFGMPLQERWLHDNWEHIAVQVALPVGAAIDYAAGEVQRGPRWMTDNGLEWLARLLIEPRRLWRRYLWGNPLFFWRVLRQRWRQFSDG